MSAPDSKGLATNMRDFAVNPNTQNMFAEHPDMLKNLLDFTTNSQDKDNESLLICMEALYALSKSKECRAKLNNIDGIMVKLAVLCDYSNGNDTERINLYAKNTMDHLAGTAASLSSNPNRLATKSSAFGTRGGYLSNVTLSLPDLTAEGRDKVESTLIGTKGIVSFTLDLNRKTATVYCSQNGKDIQPKIVESLGLAGWKAVPVVAASSADAKSAKPAKSGYMSRNTTSTDALVRYSEKKNEPKEENSAGWLGSVKSYFW